jgi:hypothetical protein
MFSKLGWAESLVRWRAFWDGKVADRPPVLIHRMASFAADISGSTEVAPNTVLARNLAFYDPAQNEALLEQAEKGLAARADMPDDMAPAIVAGGGVHFAGATFGAPVQVTASMLTSEPIIHDWSQVEGIRLDLGNAWVQRALALARQLVARSQGRYAVTVGLLEGPSDICAALRGISQLAEDIYVYPAEVRKLAEMAAEAWVTYARAMHQIVPLYDGGTVTQWSLWAPGRAAAFQEDFCTVISPRTYREFFKPLDRQIAREVDLFWVHVHAGEIHLVDELLTMDEVRGVQIVHDGDASPPLARVLQVMQRVQQRGKCLIVRKYSPEELETILPHLAAKGLAIDTYCPTADAAQRWIKRLEEWPFGRA